MDFVFAFIIVGLALIAYVVKTHDDGSGSAQSNATPDIGRITVPLIDIGPPYANNVLTMSYPMFVDNMSVQTVSENPVATTITIGEELTLEPTTIAVEQPKPAKPRRSRKKKS